MRSTYTLLALLLLTSSACGGDEAQSSSSEQGPDADGSGSGDGELPGTSSTDAGGGGGDAAAPLPPCDDAETAELQAALDGAHGANTDAVLAVKSACGDRILSSGPSKLAPSVLQRIASVTKTYTATIILQLVQEKALSLDAPASTWVKGIPGGNAIVVRHLLQHTSGLYNYTADLILAGRAKAGAKLTTQDLFDASFGHDLAFTPGSSWSYSNTNYIALGVIAEKVTGKAIHVLIRERLLTPLGVTATFFDGPEPPVGTLATPRNTFGLDISKENNPTWAGAAGAIVAAPGDLLAWTKAFGTGALVDAPTFTTMSDGKSTPQQGLTYGLGMMIFDPSATDGAGTAYGHAGDFFGFHNQSFYYPELGTAIVAMVTSDADKPGTIQKAARAVLVKHKN